MRASSVGCVDRLAAVLASRSEKMRIEGHTDNVPIYQFTPSRLSVRAMPNFIPSRGTSQPADVPATSASISSS
jgi:hypothetical protein